MFAERPGQEVAVRGTGRVGSVTELGRRLAVATATMRPVLRRNTASRRLAHRR